MIKLKNRVRKFFSIFVLIAILLVFIWYVFVNLSEFENMLTQVASNLWFSLYILLFLVIVIALNGYIFFVLMKFFNIHLNLKEWFGLSVLTRFYNFITPFRGGAVIRSLYLKKRYNFSYLSFLSTLFAIYIILFLIGSFVGLLCMLFIKYYSGFFNILIFVILLCVFLFFLLIILISPKISTSKNKWLNYFIEILNGWHLIKNNKKVLFSLIVVALLQLFFNSLTLLFSYKVFGIDINMLDVLFIASINYVILPLSLTPGNLGVADAVHVFSASIVGVGISEAVLATLFRRILELVVVFILGPIFSYKLMKNLKSLDK